MKSPSRHFAAALLALVFASGRLQAVWFKGITHVHTINSDGDSSPDTVTRWYKEHGYNFVFITDHGMITRVNGLNAVFGGDKFLVLPGEEVTSTYPAPPLHVHVNALGPQRRIVAQRGASAGETLQLDADAICAAGGVAQVNHPNFFWQLTAADIAAAKGATLMEIMNMHPVMNVYGAGPDFPGTEQMWDQVLSRGKMIWGVASDDLHKLKTEGMKAEDSAIEASPGKGWIMVRAQQLTAEAIMRAIKQGDFYASTGVTLREFAATPAEISVEVEPETRFPTKYVIAFIGAGGRLLDTKVDTKATYRPRGDEGYVRVRVLDANGRGAWAQPVDLRMAPPK